MRIFDNIARHSLCSFVCSLLMRVLAGLVDTGCVKEFNFAKHTDTSNQAGPQPEARCVLIARKGDPVIHLAFYHPGYVAVRQSGTITFYDKNYQEINEIQTEEPVIGFFAINKKLYWATKNHGGTVLTPDMKIRHFDLPDNLSIFVSSQEANGKIAFYGPDVGLRVAKVQEDTGFVETVWEAETPWDIELDQPDRVAVSDVCFVDEHHLVAVTMRGTLRVYNIMTSFGFRSVQITQNPLHLVEPTGPDAVLASNDRGLATIYSIADLKRQGNLKGIMGATRCASADNHVIVLGGLDRYLHVFDITARKHIARIYTSEEISSVLLLDAEFSQEESSGEDHDYDELWKELDKSTQKRKKMQSKENPKKIKRAQRYSLDNEEHHD